MPYWLIIAIEVGALVIGVAVGFWLSEFLHTVKLEKGKVQGASGPITLVFESMTELQSTVRDAILEEMMAAEQDEADKLTAMAIGGEKAFSNWPASVAELTRDSPTGRINPKRAGDSITPSLMKVTHQGDVRVGDDRRCVGCGYKLKGFEIRNNRLDVRTTRMATPDGLKPVVNTYCCKICEPNLFTDVGHTVDCISKVFPDGYPWGLIDGDEEEKENEGDK